MVRRVVSFLGWMVVAVTYWMIAVFLIVLICFPGCTPKPYVAHEAHTEAKRIVVEERKAETTQATQTQAKRVRRVTQIQKAPDGTTTTVITTDIGTDTTTAMLAAKTVAAETRASSESSSEVVRKVPPRPWWTKLWAIVPLLAFGFLVWRFRRLMLPAKE